MQEDNQQFITLYPVQIQPPEIIEFNNLLVLDEYNYSYYVDNETENNTNTIDTFCNFNKAYEFLCNEPKDIVSFYEYSSFHVNNIAILQDYNEEYYLHEYILHNHSDIIKEIESNVEILISWGDRPERYDLSTLTLIPLLSTLYDFKVFFLISKTSPPDDFYIKYKSYLIHNDIRRQFVGYNKIVLTDTHKYQNGVVGPKDVI